MEHFDISQQQRGFKTMTGRIFCLLVLSLMLNFCQGCERMIDLQVENLTTSTIKVIRVDGVYTKGESRIDSTVLGTVAPRNTVMFASAFIDGDYEFLVQVKDTANHLLGEVGQSGDTVHSKLSGRTWTVTIPADMTPVSTVSTAKIPQR